MLSFKFILTALKTCNLFKLHKKLSFFLIVLFSPLSVSFVAAALGGISTAEAEPPNIYINNFLYKLHKLPMLHYITWLLISRCACVKVMRSA